MSSDVTLALDGQPTLDDYAAALDGLRDLLAALAVDVAGGVRIEWAVERLDVGSALATFHGQDADEQAIGQVVDAYLSVGRAAASGDRVFFSERPRVDGAVRKILSVINGRVPSVRFETAENDVTVSMAPANVPTLSAMPSDIPGAFGAVEGRVQMVSSRNKLRFTLYDQMYDKPVSCYLQQDNIELARNIWDRIAVVEGWVKRDATGRPIAVRRIRNITLVDRADENAWRQAQGVVSASEPAEQLIRRLREAW